MSNVQKIIRIASRYEDEKGRFLTLLDLERFVDKIRDEGAPGETLISITDEDADLVLEWFE